VHEKVKIMQFGKGSKEVMQYRFQGFKDLKIQSFRGFKDFEHGCKKRF